MNLIIIVFNDDGDSVVIDGKTGNLPNYEIVTGSQAPSAFNAYCSEILNINYRNLTHVRTESVTSALYGVYTNQVYMAVMESLKQNAHMPIKWLKLNDKEKLNKQDISYLEETCKVAERNRIFKGETL